MHWALTGYYGFGNVGDDLMLYLLLEQISRLDAQAEFTVLIPKSADAALITLPAGTRATIRNATSPLAVVRALLPIDILLFGGGTCLHRGGACNLVATVLASLMGKPVHWIGIGADAIASSRALRRARLALRFCSGITFRDQASADVVAAMAPRFSDAPVTADLGLPVE